MQEFANAQGNKSWGSIRGMRKGNEAVQQEPKFRVAERADTYYWYISTNSMWATTIMSD